MPDAAQNPFLAQRKAGERVVFFRDFRVDDIDVEKRTARFSFSSDVDLERWPGYFEKLDHSKDGLDLERLNNAAALLWNHDWDECLGVVERAWIEGGKGYVLVRFGNSAKAQEVWPDVRDKILRNVSVGYEVLAEELTLNDETGCHYTVTRWAPYEVSIVTVPADISVGVGRAATLPSVKTRNTMPPETATPPATPAIAATPVTPAVTVTETRAPSHQEIAQRIIAIGAKFNAREEAAQAVADGITVQEFQQRLLERSQTAQATRTDVDLGLSEKEVKQFSFARLIAADVATKMNLSDTKRLKEAASFELEVSEASATIRTKQGRAPKGLYVPSEILRRGKINLNEEQRARFEAAQRAVVSVAGSIGTAGVGNTFAPELDTASFAELLRPESILLNRCTTVGDLTGPYEIPKHVSGATAGWLSEDGNAPGQNAIFTQLQANPHTVGGLIELTRRSLLQSALQLESIIRTDLAAGIGQEIDRAGYYGTGTNGQPLGLSMTDGIKIQQFASANPEWLELINMETIISAGNVKLNPMTGAYLLNSSGRGWAKGRQKFPTTPTGMTIWEPGDTVNGYQTGVTNQIRSGDWFLGNWKELFVAMWSGLDLLSDPFTHSASGRVRLVGLQDMDYLNRRPEAFCYGYHF